jgi:hypothetical protein
MSKYLKGPLLEASLWLVFCVLAYAFTFEFDETLTAYRYGAASWPRAIIIILAACALGQLTAAIATHRRNGEAADLKPASPAAVESFFVHGKAAGLKLIGIFLVPLIYLFLLTRTGFYLTTPFLISGYMYLLGERRLIHLVGTTLLIFALNILIFTVLLYVPLPVGNWSGFYEINNAFLSLIK